MGLKSCWNTDPGMRPSAKGLLVWVRGQLASWMLETEFTGGEKGVASYEKQNRKVQRVSLLLGGKTEYEKDGRDGQSLPLPSGEEAGYEEKSSSEQLPRQPQHKNHFIESQRSAAPGQVGSVHTRIRKGSQGSQSTSKSFSSGYLPSIHSRMNNDPEVASVRSIPGPSSSVGGHERIPFFDDIASSSTESTHGSLSSKHRKGHDSLRNVRGGSQGSIGLHERTSSDQSLEHRTDSSGPESTTSQLIRQRSSGGGHGALKMGSSDRLAGLSPEEVSDSPPLPGRTTVA